MTTSQLSTIRALRERACRHVEEGAVTRSHGCDREIVQRLLNESLATEIVCTPKYKRHDFMARGLHSESVAAEVPEHARQECEHADRLAARIVQPGGEPDFSPEGLCEHSHAQLEGILAMEEEHAEDMASLLGDVAVPLLTTIREPSLALRSL